MEAQGFDKMRSRILIHLKDGRQITGWADERYRGGPENPLSDAELEEKVRSCCANVLSWTDTDALIAAAWAVLGMQDAGSLLDYLAGTA